VKQPKLTRKCLGVLDLNVFQDNQYLYGMYVDMKLMFNNGGTNDFLDVVSTFEESVLVFSGKLVKSPLELVKEFFLVMSRKLVKVKRENYLASSPACHSFSLSWQICSAWWSNSVFLSTLS
jgi:hypothetical protein